MLCAAATVIALAKRTPMAKVLILAGLYPLFRRLKLANQLVQVEGEAGICNFPNTNLEQLAKRHPRVMARCAEQPRRPQIERSEVRAGAHQVHLANRVAVLLDADDA